MEASTVLGRVRQRLANRTDSEHSQALVRIAIVFVVSAYFFSDYFTARVDPDGVRSAQLLVLTSIIVALTIFAAILIRPGASVVRRLAGMLHDVAAISGSVYFGDSAGAAVAVIYLWVTIGNGFRYGIRYLYGCAVLSIVGFLLVYSASDYWQAQSTLSLNILLSMLIVPPYVGGLLRSLHAAKDALQYQASVDALTGLLSRQEMEAAIEAVFAGGKSGNVLLFCDLDRFKTVNDIAGHAAGDKLLTDVGEIVRSCVRRNDLCSRFGGDEFCILLRDCGLDRARKVAETLRSKTTGYRLAWGTDYFSVGVSIGVAPDSAVKDADSLFRLADAACYAAKNSGRNRVHVVDPRTDLVDTQKIRNMFEAGACAENR